MSEPAVAIAQPELPLAIAPSGRNEPKRFVIPEEKSAPAAATPAPAASEAPEKKVAQDTGEQATPPASDGDQPKEEVKEEVTPEQAAKREGRRFERRLDKAYRKAADAQARADLLEKQLNEARQVTAPKPVEGEPKLADFDYDPEKYAAAKADFATKQKEKELSTKQQQEAQQQYRKKLIASYEEKVVRADSKYDDYDTVVGELQPNSPFVVAIMDAENSEDVAYYLGKHPKEAEKIAALPPYSQIREIGKLEAKLLAEAKKPIAPSKAPAPITPVTGASAPLSAEPSDNDDISVWIKKRQKQVHGKR